MYEAGQIFKGIAHHQAPANVKVGDILTIHFGNKETKVEILDVQETVKKDEAKELFRYI